MAQVDCDGSNEIGEMEFVSWAKANTQHLDSCWWEGAPVDQAASSSLAVAPVGGSAEPIPCATGGPVSVPSLQASFSFTSGGASGALNSIPFSSTLLSPHVLADSTDSMLALGGPPAPAASVGVLSRMGAAAIASESVSAVVASMPPPIPEALADSQSAPRSVSSRVRKPSFHVVCVCVCVPCVCECVSV